MSKTTGIRYPKNWTHKAVRKYLTQESQQKSKEVFEKTHVPIRRIKVTRNNNVSGFDNEYIDEETFRDGVTASGLEDDNRMFFVVGEAGSGKSELCQWLQYEIEALSHDRCSHIPIHIPRQVREPREVLGRLADYLDDEPLDDAKRLADLPAQGVFEKTIGTIAVAFNKNDPVIDLIEDGTFRDKVRENLRTYVDAFDDPQSELEFEPISEEDIASLLDEYPAARDEHGREELPAEEKLFDVITRQAKDAIKEMLFVGDIKETLRQIDQRFQERDERPVLIIEDLTGFTIFQHEILSFFSDLGAAHWDVVIGVTTGMEKKLVEGRRADIASQETINDRIAARVTLTERTEDGAKTLFLEQEGVHIDLARTYLRAIKQESGGEFEGEPDISKEKVNEVFGDDLYPFNEHFLTRIYENLQENDQRKQTPRVFLKFVIEGLLDSDSPPFQQAELLDTLGRIDCLITADYEETDRNILKWYGLQNDEENVQEVDRRIPETFGIESNGKAPLTAPNSELCPECGLPMEETTSGSLVCENCDTTCDECGARMKQEGEFWVCTEESDHKRPIGGRSQLFKSRLQELLDWRGEGSDFNQTSDIKDGAERAIKFFHDQPTSLVRQECRSGEAGALWWSKGGRRVPIHVDNNDEPQYRMVILRRNLPETLLKDLLRLGIYDQSSVEEHIKNESVDAQQLRVWAEDAVEELRTEAEKDIIREFGTDLDKVALFGKYLLNIFTGIGSEFSAKALAKPVNMNRFSTTAKPREVDFTISKLENYGETILGLFHARFHLRTNMVDYERLKSHIESTSPQELCNEIKGMSAGIRGFKVGPKKTDSIDLKEFLTDPTHFGLRTIARSLDEYAERQYDKDLAERRQAFKGLQTFYEPIDSLNEIDWSKIDDAYDRLPSTHTTESIKKVQNLSKEEAEPYDTTLVKINRITERLDTVNDVWAFLSVCYEIADVKYVRMSDQYKRLKSLRDDLEDLDSKLEDQIRSLEDEIDVEVDTTPFSKCQDQALQLESLLGEPR